MKSNWIGQLRALGLLCALVGCNGGEQDTGDDSTTTIGGSESDGMTDGTTGTTGTTEATPTTGDETGGSQECSPSAQDCPEGLKCTAYAEPGEAAWTANKCIMEVPNGPGLGETCEVMGDNQFSGIDNCAEGTICLHVDEDLKNGFCVEFCDAEVGKCADNEHVCIPANDGALPTCLATCDPLLQDCQGGGCYGDPSGPPFICFFVDAVGGGMHGDPCSFANACLEGLNCSDASTVEGCNTPEPGCCSPFCGLDEVMPCAGAEECVPFFAEAQPGYENVGICALPG